MIVKTFPSPIAELDICQQLKKQLAITDDKILCRRESSTAPSVSLTLQIEATESNNTLVNSIITSVSENAEKRKMILALAEQIVQALDKLDMLVLRHLSQKHLVEKSLIASTKFTELEYTDLESFRENLRIQHNALEAEVSTIPGETILFPEVPTFLIKHLP